MELLVIMIAQLLAVALAPLAAVLLAVGGGMVGLVVTIFLAIVGEASSYSTSDVKPEKPQPRRTRRRIWPYMLLAPFVVVAVGVFIANQFFFAPSMRLALNIAAERAGYTVDVGALEGSIWSGQLALDDLTISGKAENHAATMVSVGRIEADLAVLSLLTSTVRMDKLAASDVDVQVRQAARVDAQLRQDKTGVQRKSGRRFVVEDLHIKNAVVVVDHPQRGQHELRIDTASVAPLRSGLAAFDLLFRSNLDATFDGARLIVSTVENDGGGRRTDWALEQVELRTLSAFTNAAPVRWFQAGTLSATMQDEWRRDDRSINSNWVLTLRDTAIVVPDGAGLSETVLVQSLSKIAQAQHDDINLTFQLALDEKGFRDSASGDLSAWWGAMVKGFAGALAGANMGNAENTEGRLNEITQGVRGILGIKRD